MPRTMTLESILSDIAYAAGRPVETRAELDMLTHELSRLTEAANMIKNSERGPDAWRIMGWIAAIEVRVASLPSQIAMAADRIADVMRCAEAGNRGEMIPREMRRY
ncbi:hypothetical protein ACOI1H_21655 [Loktanella sp. DJP18]|uniref:hypothetical protein n=1 Tax=Loktanella sp. DJP18 TaxID=3409788 RepID=UPI003BB58A70